LTIIFAQNIYFRYTKKLNGFHWLASKLIYGGKLFDSLHTMIFATLCRAKLLEYLTTSATTCMCKMQPQHHRYEYLTIHICCAVLALHMHMVADIKLNIQGVWHATDTFDKMACNGKEPKSVSFLNTIDKLCLPSEKRISISDVQLSL